MKVFVLLLCVGLCWAVPVPDELEIVVEDVFTDDSAEVVEGLYEGDIVIPRLRNAIRGASHKWPNHIIPYTIESSFPSTTKATIVQAMREIESNTKHGTTNCVHFVERTTQPDYIYIHKGTGCHSKIGHQGGQQEVSIGTGCERKGTIMHELNHALGFWHEQNRYDRDSHVTVLTANIDPPHLHDFTKRTTADMDTMGTPYDFGSIMHYGPYTFARDKSHPTLSPKAGQAHGVTMGQRLAMSVQDVTRIQKLYGCTIDTSHITKPSTSLDVVNCNFDTNLCNLQQDSHDNFDWIRRTGATPTANTGPNADHTTSAGAYIYAEATGHRGQKTRILSPDTAGGQYCVDFFLYQHGNQEGNFQVLAAGPRIREQSVKTIAGEQSAEWKHFRINLNVPADFHLILQATIGAGDSSDIALDDFNFYHGRCL